MWHATTGCDETEDQCRYAHRKPRPDEMGRVETWKANREAKAKTKGKAKAKAKSASAAVLAMAVLSGTASDASATAVGAVFGRCSGLRVSGIDVIEVELPEECTMNPYFHRQHSGGRDNPPLLGRH